MKTLMLTVAMAFAAAATAAGADEANVPTITVTAKRLHAATPAVERVAPRAVVEIAVFLPTDMPEVAIDYHLSAIGASPAPAVERVTL